jgi:hypothetical protein
MDKSAVEMTPRGKRGKLKSEFPTLSTAFIGIRTMMRQEGKRATESCSAVSRRVRRAGRGFQLRLWPPLLLVSPYLTGWRLQSQQASTFSAEVRVANVLATLRSEQGGIIRNLTKDKFLLAGVSLIAKGAFARVGQSSSGALR